MKIRQHIPDWVSLEKSPKEDEFDDLIDLLGIDWVAAFRKQAHFDHFAIAPYGKGWLLIAVFNGGHTWWVVGHINELTEKMQDYMLRWNPPD